MVTSVPSYPDLVTSEGDTRLLCARGEEDSRARTSGLLGDACQVTSEDLCSSDPRLMMQGFSGGPLVVEDDITGRWALAGVVTGRSSVQCPHSHPPLHRRRGLRGRQLPRPLRQREPPPGLAGHRGQW